MNDLRVRSHNVSKLKEDLSAQNEKNVLLERENARLKASKKVFICLQAKL